MFKKKFLKNCVFFVGIIIIFLCFQKIVYASSEPPRISDIQDMLVRVIDVFYAFGGIIFLVLALVIGFQYMTAAGDDEKLGEVKQRITYWVIGFFLYFMSYAIVLFVYNLFEVKDCNDNLVKPGFHLIFSEACPSP